MPKIACYEIAADRFPTSRIMSQGSTRDTRDLVLLLFLYTLINFMLHCFLPIQYPYLRLDGSTSASQRQGIVNRFNASYGKDFVLLLSSKAGGTGLNLIGASRILLYDMDWNPAHDVQGNGGEASFHPTTVTS